MMVVVTYDVYTSSKRGIARLNKVAKICKDYGQRVQNCVFECIVTPSQFTELKLKISDVINLEEDSIRYYLLGKKWENRVESYGRKKSYNLERETFVF